MTVMRRMESIDGFESLCIEWVEVVVRALACSSRVLVERNEILCGREIVSRFVGQRVIDF